MYSIEELFDLRHTLAAQYLRRFERPWAALAGIAALIDALGPALGAEYVQRQPRVWVHKTAEIAPTACLGAPCIIGPETQVRHCAFIRGAALVGAGCVVGNSVELKNAILLDGVQLPHYNYVGDSILGHCAHLGAGAITSNVKSDGSEISMQWGEARVNTGLKKLGALCGDFVEVGCNSVLNPGTVIGRGSTVYPLISVRGTVPAGSICKPGGAVVRKT